MLAFGIILVIVGIGGGALIGYLSTASDDAVTLAAGGVSVSLLPITLFASGAAAVLLVWLGFRLTAHGFRHKRAQRRELKDSRRVAKERQASGPASSGPGERSETGA